MLENPSFFHDVSIQIPKPIRSDRKDAALREKEDSNSVLRRDLMETVAKFGQEKVRTEK